MQRDLGLMDDSIYSPKSKQEQFHKSARSGGGVFTKGAEKLNFTSSFHIDRYEENKDGGMLI